MDALGLDSPTFLPALQSPLQPCSRSPEGIRLPCLPPFPRESFKPFLLAPLNSPPPPPHPSTFSSLCARLQYLGTLYLGTQWPDRARTKISNLYSFLSFTTMSPVSCPAPRQTACRGLSSLPPSPGDSPKPCFPPFPRPLCQPPIPRNTLYLGTQCHMWQGPG